MQINFTQKQSIVIPLQLGVGIGRVQAQKLDPSQPVGEGMRPIAAQFPDSVFKGWVRAGHGLAGQLARF